MGEGCASYYGWRAIKYFMFEYELSLKNSTKSSREKLNWNYFVGDEYVAEFSSIEHIYPQNARDKYCDVPPAAIPISWREVQGFAG